MVDFFPRLYSLEGRLLEKQNTLQSIKEREKFLEKETTILKEAIEICILASKYLQEQVEVCISSIVTECLHSIYDDPYDFSFDFSIRGNKIPEATPILTRRGERFLPVLGTGGGVANVITFALRVGCLIISGSDRVIILDEPFNGVSRDLQPKIKEMLEQMSSKLGFQFCIITQEDLLL